eukprot:TRINITY_DN9091_c0_g1_i1.p1 TRINITY_DN9091_c0_g1~~TRINITY_DN9091_c0_g1_i1.p1  ORF type:complete len:397 (+),score=96.43 TRINITY_DN9091_c0_g1_i1:101-1291(+)
MESSLASAQTKEAVSKSLLQNSEGVPTEEFTYQLKRQLRRCVDENNGQRLLLLLQSLAELGYRIPVDYTTLDLNESFKLLVEIGNIDACCGILSTFLDNKIVISRSAINLTIVTAVGKERTANAKKLVLRLLGIDKGGEVLELGDIFAEFLQQDQFEACFEMLAHLPPTAFATRKCWLLVIEAAIASNAQIEPLLDCLLTFSQETRKAINTEESLVNGLYLELVKGCLAIKLELTLLLRVAGDIVTMKVPLADSIVLEVLFRFVEANWKEEDLLKLLERLGYTVSVGVVLYLTRRLIKAGKSHLLLSLIDLVFQEKLPRVSFAEIPFSDTDLKYLFVAERVRSRNKGDSPTKEKDTKGEASILENLSLGYEKLNDDMISLESVSYTHLTLPTIYSV